MAEEEIVLYETRGHVAILTLNRLKARNAINQALSAAIEACMDKAEADDSIFAIILTHNGPTFCAGADLKGIAAGDNFSTERGGLGGLAFRQRIKPLICAANGGAHAGGLELVLACDMCVAAESAVFALTEVKRGLLASGGGIFRLPQRVPKAIAMEMAITGDSITAERAYQAGLVNIVTEDDGALEGALGLAARITANAPLAA